MAIFLNKGTIVSTRKFVFSLNCCIGFTTPPPASACYCRHQTQPNNEREESSWSTFNLATNPGMHYSGERAYIDIAQFWRRTRRWGRTSMLPDNFQNFSLSGVGKSWIWISTISWGLCNPEPEMSRCDDRTVTKTASLRPFQTWNLRPLLILSVLQPHVVSWWRALEVSCRCTVPRWKKKSDYFITLRAPSLSFLIKDVWPSEASDSSAR